MGKELENAIGGKLKLKLKGKPQPIEKHKVLKRKKHRNRENVDHSERSSKNSTEHSDLLEKQLRHNTETLDDSQNEQFDSELAVDDNPGKYLTTAEKVFRAAQYAREKSRVNEKLQLTHRQRVEKFNKHLSTLSEHFDIPKVGPG